MMLSWFARTFGTFALIVGAYFLYAEVAVPLALPEHVRTGGPIDEPSDGLDEELIPYLSLFREDSWERDPKSKVQKLELDQIVILFRKDHIEGSIARLEPCTILFLDKKKGSNSDSPADESERIRQAMILRTPQYAEIEFDGELSFSKFPLPNIKGGKLLGKVSITSDMKEPGPQDDLNIDTENVVFVESPALTAISTQKDVFFRWGPNSGVGSVLRINLEPTIPNSPKELTRLQFDSLRRMNLVFPKNGETTLAAAPGPQPANGAPKTANAVPPLTDQSPLPPVDGTSSDLASATLVAGNISLVSGPATRLDIQCQREFVFLPDEKKGDWRATFNGNVLAIQTNPDGSADQITGDELYVKFSPKPNQQPSSDGGVAGLGSMEPTFFYVAGKAGIGTQAPVPARLSTKQSGGVVMLGDEIQYDLKTHRVQLTTKTLSGQDGRLSRAPGASADVAIFLQENRYVLRSVLGFQYTFDPNGGIGVLVAPSPGSLEGILGEGNQAKRVFATWNELQIEPDKFDPKQMVVHMNNGVQFDMQGFNKLTAEKFNLWCFVNNEPSSADKRPKSAAASPNPPKMLEGNTTLTPDRAMVLGKVHLENENGTIDVNRLDLFFETVSPSGTISKSRWTPHSLYGDAPICRAGASQTEILQPLKNALQNPRSADGSVAQIGNVIGGGKGIVSAAGEALTEPRSIALVQHLEPYQFQPPPTPATANPSVANQAVLPAPAALLPTAATGQQPQQPGGLLGFGSGTSRSAYAITGDQMQMLVRNVNGSSTPDKIRIDGNVRIVEKLLNAPGNEAIEILGEEIKVWNPSTPETQIQINGKPPKEAVFRGKGIALNAMQLNIQRASNMIWSDGAGRLLASVPTGGGQPNVVINQGTPRAANGQQPLTSLRTANAPVDNRVLVDWNEQMSFDGKTIVFKGKASQTGVRVRVIHQNTLIYADALKIHLNRLVSFFDNRSDVQVKAESLECAGNVFIRTEEFEGQQRKSLNEGEFDGVRVYVETGDFVAWGGGCVRSTFMNNGKGMSASGPLAQVAPKGGIGKLAHLGVIFYDSIRGNYNSRTTEISDTVKCVYCPVNSWDEKIGIENRTSATKTGFLLDCDKLLIAQMPDPATGTLSVEMTATGNTTLEGNNLLAKAATVKYNQAKHLVIFDGDGFGNARVTSKGKSATAKKFAYDIETGDFQTFEAEGYEFGR